jgi:DNA primase
VFGTGGFDNLVLPDYPQAATVIIAADGDEAGYNAARRRMKWTEQGRSVRISDAPPGHDFNELPRAAA